MVSYMIVNTNCSARFQPIGPAVNHGPLAALLACIMVSGNPGLDTAQSEEFLRKAPEATDS